MRGILEDLRYASGVLRRTPAWTAVAVLTLALDYCRHHHSSLAGSMGWSCTRSAVPLDDGQLAVLESVRASGLLRLLAFRMLTPGTSRTACGDISGLLLNQKGPASIGDGENAYSAWFELVSRKLLRRPGGSYHPWAARSLARNTAIGPERRRRSSATGCGRSILARGDSVHSPAVPQAHQPAPESPSSAWRLRNFTAIFRGPRWMAGYQSATDRRKPARCAELLQAIVRLKTRRQHLRGKRRSGDGCPRAACPRLSEDQRGDRRPDRTDLEGAGRGVKRFGIAAGHPGCRLRTRSSDCVR